MLDRLDFVLLLLVPALFVAACTPTSDPVAPAKPPSNSENARGAQLMSDAKEIASNAPLEAGHVVFEGMVAPTKGGYYVRGVVIEDDLLPKALAHAAPADVKNAEWFVGAVVRVVGQLRKHEEKPASDDGVVMQMRAGEWFELEPLERAELVKPAEMIEGTLERSKGFYAVGQRLVSRDDVAWSLGPQGGKEGDKVRFYGQSRTVVCEPNAQCLIQGSLPLFDVGRAEKLP